VRPLRRAALQREDDRPESITVRMQAYDRSTAPLIEFYRSLGFAAANCGNGIARRDLRSNDCRACGARGWC